jgi:hypothetical protein
MGSAIADDDNGLGAGVMKKSGFLKASKESP